ncbi:septum formation inhibitor Maf [Candidatus Poribacteria bacterium]|nr:septum formation inhibitor Maf [Candidatus Poribacteria bacterium]MYA99304.1 septum formation inhibitor Maf [Candidatus Poribacteria bacterium]
MQTRECPVEIPHLILASASPRRSALLTQIGLTFKIHPSDIVEPPHTVHANKPASEVTQELAALKAAAVTQHYNHGLIIGADTLVSLDGELLGKPTDDADALAMLSRLSGTCHEVVTGVALIDAATGEDRVWAETTQVYFRQLNAAEITTYIESGEASDKAGAYGIQGRGAVFVRRIEGCYFNVVGLPLASLVEHLSNFPSNVGI